MQYKQQATERGAEGDDGRTLTKRTSRVVRGPLPPRDAPGPRRRQAAIGPSSVHTARPPSRRPRGKLIGLTDQISSFTALGRGRPKRMRVASKKGLGATRSSCTRAGRAGVSRDAACSTYSSLPAATASRYGRSPRETMVCSIGARSPEPAAHEMLVLCASRRQPPLRLPQPSSWGHRKASRLFASLHPISRSPFACRRRSRR